MKEYHLFYAPHLAKTHELPTDEAAHAVRVLRMQEGDELLATDGCGTFYKCILTLATQKHCTVRIEDTTKGEHPWQGKIHLAVAPTKNMDRMEWLAEKATEIGLDTISFLDCQNSERHIVKTNRVERIVIAATKQSHKAWKPEISEIIRFKDFIHQERTGRKFIAHCYDTGEPKPLLVDTLRPGTDATLLIGPEGDFSLDEVRMAIAAGYEPISLGRSRLRTETAALCATHIANLILSH